MSANRPYSFRIVFYSQCFVVELKLNTSITLTRCTFYKTVVTLVVHLKRGKGGEFIRVTIFFLFKLVLITMIKTD